MRAIFMGLILGLTIFVWAADKVQPLNVKTGLWETTATIATSGAMPIPAELLSKLTPEQRARMEDRLKASAAEKIKTTTSKKCLTKEELEKGLAFGEQKKECTQTVVTSTSNKAEVRVACENETMNSSGTIQIEALSRESVKGSGQMSVTDGGHTMNANTTFTAKWIGPICGETK